MRLEREPVPVLGGTADFFIGSVAPMVNGRGEIQSKERLARLLHATPPFDQPRNNYGGWIALKKEDMPLEVARAALEQRQQVAADAVRGQRASCSSCFPAGGVGLEACMWL